MEKIDRTLCKLAQHQKSRNHRLECHWIAAIISQSKIRISPTIGPELLISELSPGSCSSYDLNLKIKSVKEDQFDTIYTRSSYP